jgi:hypothetical protein
MVIIAATQTLPTGNFIHRSQILSDPDSGAGKPISGYDARDPSDRINQVPTVAFHPVMAWWYQFTKQAGSMSLPAWVFLYENRCCSWEPMVRQARNFRENCFFKKLYAIMPHTQRLGFETRVGEEIVRQPRGLARHFEAGTG